MDTLLSQMIHYFDAAYVNVMHITRDNVDKARNSSTTNRLPLTSNDLCHNKGDSENDKTLDTDDIDHQAANDKAPLTLCYCYVTNSAQIK